MAIGIFKLKPEVKKLWLDALRSERYAQAQKRLMKPEYEGKPKACCLGVLCDVMMKEGLIEGEWKSVSLMGETRLSFVTPNGSNTLLPPEDVIRAAFDMPKEAFDRSVVTVHRTFATKLRNNSKFCRGVLLDDHDARLFELNDNGASFAEIADIIEEKM